MKNKGFTLIEILTVLAILAVVILTIFPIVIGRIDTSRERTYKIQIGLIEKAATDWALSPKNLSSIPEGEGEVLTLNLGDLKIGGFIDMDIKNPLTNVSFPNDMLITITKKGERYDVVVVEDSGTNIEDEDIVVGKSPTIVLNGPYLSYVELNEEYIELFGKAYSYDGIDLTDNIGKEIMKDGIQRAMVDSSQIGTYKIYYIIVDPDNGYKNTAVRTVIIRDTTVPILEFEEITTITLSEVDEFDYMQGVSASDNSNVDVDITYTGTIENSVGSYVITYTATDVNNNKTVKKRIIKVI